MEKGLLKQLDQFAGGPVRVIFSDIVYREIERHVLAKAVESRTKVNAAIRAAEAHLSIEDVKANDAKALLLGAESDQEIAEARLKRFCERCNAEIVATSEHADVSKLIELYFAGKPPFENARDRKREFPDAFALLAIDAWAEKQDVKVLAVSKDRGWTEFSKNSGRLDVIENLADAIAHFQPHNATKQIIHQLRGSLLDIENGCNEKLVAAISSSLEDSDIVIEASSAHHYEEDDVHAKYVSHQLALDAAGLPEVQLIRVGAEELVFSLACIVTCEVHASFSLSVWDSIDREYLSIGSVSHSIEEQYATEILLSLTGDVSKQLADLEVVDVEVLETISHADFGEIEADWGYEE